MGQASRRRNLRAVGPAGKPAEAPEAETVTFDLPPELRAEIAAATAQIAVMTATIREFDGYRNGMVKAFLLAQKFTPVETVGAIAESGRYSVVVKAPKQARQSAEEPVAEASEESAG